MLGENPELSSVYDSGDGSPSSIGGPDAVAEEGDVRGTAVGPG